MSTGQTFDDLKRLYGWVPRPRPDCPNCGEATAFSFPEELKDTTSFKKKDNDTTNSQCPPPIPPEQSKNKETVADLIRSSGGDAQCTQDSEYYNQNSSGSMRAQVETWIASAGAEAKWQQSTTSNRARQMGCGSLLIKASNIVQKRNTMQCIVESCKQETTISANAGATITISTLPLTPEEAIQKAELIEKNTEANLQAQASQDRIMSASLEKLGMDKIEALQKYFINANKVRLDAQAAQLQLYSRNINIEDSRITVNAKTEINARIALSTDASNKLSKLSDDIARDVAEMTVANQLGVNAMAPQVKSVVSQNRETTDNTSSSSLSDIGQKTSVSAGASGEIIITAPGIINIKRTVIDANVTASVIVQQIMNRAIANGLELASKTMNDTQSVQGLLNSVSGLDEAQKAVNEGLKVGTENTLPSGGGSSAMIGFAVGGMILLFGVLYMFFGRGGGSGPNIIIPQYKFDGNLSNPQNVFYIMVIVFLVLFLLALAIRRPSRNIQYKNFKDDCASNGSRLCSSEELCNQVKKERLQGVSYSAVSDGENNWVQYNEGLCKKHQQEPPNNQRVVSRCCPVHGTPTQMPTQIPTQMPMQIPTQMPMQIPTQMPSFPPLQNPTSMPTLGQQTR